MAFAAVQRLIQWLSPSIEGLPPASREAVRRRKMVAILLVIFVAVLASVVGQVLGGAYLPAAYPSVMGLLMVVAFLALRRTRIATTAWRWG